MVKDEWIVHPNRSEIGPDKPGRNAHYRTERRPRRTATASQCIAQVQLPRDLEHLADADGTVSFGGDDWWWVVGVAFMFAQKRLGSTMPPFGYTRGGQWWWWDNTTSEESIMQSPEASAYVQEYLDRLFAGMPVALIDRR